MIMASEQASNTQVPFPLSTIWRKDYHAMKGIWSMNSPNASFEYIYYS